MKEFLKKNYRYFFLFLFALLINLLCHERFYDGLTQYGMAHALRIGELPYRDFNTIVPPLYIFICMIPLLLWDNFFVFLILNSVFYTFLYYFADKILEKRKLTFFLVSLLPLFDIISPSYNLLAKLFVVILIFMEKEKKSDISIGVVLGLLILTKHSIGLCIFLCSLFCCRKWRSAFQRFLGVLLPLVVFFIYLILTNTFSSFYDLCILGLFNFGKKNTSSVLLIVIFSLSILIFYFVFLLRHKREDNFVIYYAIGSFSFLIPIFNFSHFSGFFFFFLLVIFMKYKFPFHGKLLSVFLIGLVSFLFFFSGVVNFQNLTLRNYPHLFFFFESYPEQEKLIEYYEKKYPNSIMIDAWSMKYDIATNKKITYFDVPLTGNYGYLGTQNMIQRLKKDTYFFISKYYESSFVDQFDRELCQYVIDNSELVDSVGEFNIYYY